MKFNSAFALAAMAPSALALPSVAPRSDASAMVSRAALGEQSNSFHVTDEVADALEKALGAVEAVPDEVLEKGDDAAHQWFQDNGYGAASQEVVPVEDSEDNGVESRGFWDVAKCVATIAAAIGSDIIPVLKLTKIKNFIKSLGGIKAAIDKLKKAEEVAKKEKISVTDARVRIGGNALKDFAAEILGITAIGEACT